MGVYTHRYHCATTGADDLQDITPELHSALRASGLRNGCVTVFVVGSTAAIVTFEYEPGLIVDMRRCYEQLAPRAVSYAHDQTWQDGNGFSHVRAALQGPSLVIPFADGEIVLGTWQQVVLAEFDTSARQRTVIMTYIGE